MARVSYCSVPLCGQLGLHPTGICSPLVICCLLVSWGVNTLAFLDCACAYFLVQSERRTVLSGCICMTLVAMANIDLQSHWLLQ